MDIIAAIILFCLGGILLSECLRYLFGFHSFLVESKRPWVGFDFDGTIAVSRSAFNPRIVGEPIPEMIALIKKYLDEGMEVKILTARVAASGSIRRIVETLITRRYVQKWCLEHIGRKLEVTCMKDFRMVVLYDDRAIRVEANTGKLL